MTVDLAVREEPTETRGVVAENVARSRGEFDETVDRRLPVTDPSPERVVLGSEIGTYLWRAWEADLRDLGFGYLGSRNLLSHGAAAPSR